MNFSVFHQKLKLIVLILILVSTNIMAETNTDKYIRFNIPAQNIDVALKLFAQQTEIQVLFPYEYAKERKANSVVGLYTLEEALTLLLKDTDLKAVFTKHGDLTVQVEKQAQEGDQVKTKTSFFSKLSALLFSTLLTQGVSAQNTDAGVQGLEEIVVTAQRREQSLQDVPISLDVVSGADIYTQGYRNMNDLAGFTPTLVITPDVQNQVIQVRGVGTTGSNFGFEQAVPTFVDGIHYGRASQIKGSFLDIERVEVMRGPQPVFFGQNATAGALSITTRKPGPEWTGHLIGEAGNNGIKTIEFGTGGPITDTFGIRLAGKYDESDGFMRDVVTRDKFPFTKSYVGRATMQWVPAEAWDVTLQFSFADTKSGGRAQTLGLSGKGDFDIIRGSGALAAGLLEGVSIEPLRRGITNWGVHHGPVFFTPPDSVRLAAFGGPHLVPDLVPFSQGVDFAGTGYDFTDRDVSEPWNGYLLVNYELQNGWQFSSQTGYSAYKRVYMRSFGTGGPFPLNPLSRDEDLDQWSQEFRLSSPIGETFEWMVGAYYQVNDLNTSSNSWRATNRSNAVRRATSYDDARWMSAFIATTYHINENFSLDLGARYTDVHKVGFADFRQTVWIVEGGGPVTANGQVVTGFVPYGDPISTNTGEYDAGELDPQVVLRWKPNDSVSTYVKWAQSFKAGGFDTAVTTPPPQEDFEFEAEHAEVWEAGIKSTLLDGRASFDMNIYNSTFDNLQLSSFDEVVQRNRTTNVGKQRVRGLEFNTRYAVNEKLTLGLSGALTDGKMVEFPGANCTSQEIELGQCPDGRVDRSGEEALRTPDWQFVINMDYKTPFMDAYVFGANSKFIASDGYVNDDNFDKVVTMHSYTDMNLSISISDINERWKLSVWGRNLLEPLPTYNPENDLVPNGLIETALHSNMFKTYGIQARYNF